MKRTKVFLALSLFILAAVALSGCSVKLKHGELALPDNPAEGELAVCRKAKNMKNEIGWGTFTVIAIPVAKVTVEGEADEELMLVVKESVEQMGYQAVFVDKPADATDLPVLSVRVKKCKFMNYTWLFPLVLNWGKIEMDVSVTSPEGEVLWNKTYKGKAEGLYNFDPTVNKALNKILNEMVQDMTSPEFKKSVWGEDDLVGLNAAQEK